MVNLVATLENKVTEVKWDVFTNATQIKETERQSSRNESTKQKILFVMVLALLANLIQHRWIER